MVSLSKRELKLISWLERKAKRFFTIKEAMQLFRNKTQAYNVLRGLRTKKRIVKISKHKYFYVPVKSLKGKWAENPFVIVAEIMEDRTYYIAGKAAEWYYGKQEQIPTVIEVASTTKQGRCSLLGFVIRFLRRRKISPHIYVTKKTNDHFFNIIKEEHL